MMKTIWALLVLLATTPCAWAASKREDQTQNRYPYCNVYTASACFGIASGDVMTMRIPVDFVTYEVDLAGGAKVLIYSGYSPEDLSADFASNIRKYPAHSGTYEAAQTVDGKYAITFSPHDRTSPMLQILARQVEPAQRKSLSDFLGAFRACTSKAHRAICDKEAPIFQEFARAIRGEGRSE